MTRSGKATAWVSGITTVKQPPGGGDLLGLADPPANRPFCSPSLLLIAYVLVPLTSQKHAAQCLSPLYAYWYPLQVDLGTKANTSACEGSVGNRLLVS